nr:hypothetical protein [Tanacetum cinerariifolium]
RISLGPAGIVQQAKLLKQRDILLGRDGAVMSTQDYMKKVVEDVYGDEDFKSGSWVSATKYVNANGVIVSGCCLGDNKNFLNSEKLDQVVTIIKSCSSNVIGDLTVNMKDLSGAALILANVSVFSPKASKHYLNITMRNVVKPTTASNKIRASFSISERLESSNRRRRLESSRSDMIVDNEIQKPLVQQRVHPLVVQQHVQPSVVQQHVQPQPLHMVAGNMVEKDLATRDHVDIHGKENLYSCAIDPSFKICLEGADTTTCNGPKVCVLIDDTPVANNKP